MYAHRICFSVLLIWRTDIYSHNCWTLTTCDCNGDRNEPSLQESTASASTDISAVVTSVCLLRKSLWMKRLWLVDFCLCGLVQYFWKHFFSLAIICRSSKRACWCNWVVIRVRWMCFCVGINGPKWSSAIHNSVNASWWVCTVHLRCPFCFRFAPGNDQADRNSISRLT